MVGFCIKMNNNQENANKDGLMKMNGEPQPRVVQCIRLVPIEAKEDEEPLPNGWVRICKNKNKQRRQCAMMKSFLKIHHCGVNK